MNEQRTLDERLGRLAVGPGDASDETLRVRAATLRSRADRRRVRRRRGVVAAVPVAALLVVAAVFLTGGSGGTEIRSQPANGDRATSDTSDPPLTDGGTIGEATGLSVTVSPNTDLRDGDQVTVQSDGLDQLTSPMLIQCAGDLTAATALGRCDLRQLDPADSLATGSQISANETVTVRRIISISTIDDGAPTTYDCATEPAGCVLAIGDSAPPVRGAYAPLVFRAGEPLPTPQIAADPASELSDGSVVTVTGSGLRPNSIHSILQCSVPDDRDDPVRACDEMGLPTARTDGRGELRTHVTARAAIYGSGGRIDCTRTRCEFAVGEGDGGRVAGAPLSFAADVVAPVPALRISPAGPYIDGQEVNITGSGFPPGSDIGGQIGICPVGKDTAIEERCSRPSVTATVVDADGMFEMTARLSPFVMITGPCTEPPGCHLGWVLPHGPTVAITPLDFR